MTTLLPDAPPTPGATLTRPRRRLGYGTTVTLILAALALILVMVSLATGTVAVSLWDTVRAAVGIDTGTGADFIVGQLRAPRIYTAALVGVLLATSGALMQSIARNPLASPDLLGVSAGAAAGAVLCIYVSRTTSSLALAPFAVCGALAAAALVIVLGSQGRLEPFRMIIAGIGVNFVATAVITLTLTKIPQDVVPQAYAWIVGSTNARNWEHVALGFASCVVLVPLAIFMVRRLRVLRWAMSWPPGWGCALAGCALLRWRLRRSLPVLRPRWWGPSPSLRWLLLRSRDASRRARASPWFLPQSWAAFSQWRLTSRPGSCWAPSSFPLACTRRS